MRDKNISVRVKFFSDIDKEIKLRDYDPGKGIIMTISPGKRLKYLLKSAGVNTSYPYLYLRDGRRITRWTKLRDGDEITILKPSGGG
ncbi:MAG: hypothetical protein JXA07_13065 [Spirochaetes bacterium]|nr:hypothetical protein [Spirochaetota bacterium]